MSQVAPQPVERLSNHDIPSNCAVASCQPTLLVATPLGKPLYDSRRFSVVSEVVIMTGAPVTGPASSEVAPLVDVEAAVALDRRFTGCDRGGMLRGRFREAFASTTLADDQLAGYALTTAQGQHSVVGPLMAETEDAARLLAGAAFAACAGGPVRIDVPAEQGGFRRWLAGLGLKEQAVRVEMVRGATKLPWQVPQRFALGTQAWG